MVEPLLCTAYCSGKIILIHKKGDTQTPENFRPIALTSTIGKVFHKILSRRLEKFCLQNGIIDSSTQKGFLHGVNGTMEHIFTTTSIIEHAKRNGLPVSISFLDLKNAFGSVSHKLISDILYHIKLPTSVRDYINNTYSKLQAFEWSTELFPITRGVFQGDTMSPIIFLLTFNPIIQLVRRLECPGFFFKIPIPNSENLPSEGSTIYITWDEANSNEDSGWYRCVVTKYLPNGKVEVTYPNSSIEMLDLNSVNWTFARKFQKISSFVYTTSFIHPISC